MQLIPSLALTVIIEAMKNRHNTLIWGAPGCAKTSVVLEAAEQLGWNIIVFHPVVDDTTTYSGFPWVVTNGEGEPVADFVPYAGLAKLMNAKEPTIAFFDDLGQATPAVQAACMQLLLARSINGKQISDEVRFIAATNRREDRAGVSGILEPVKSRFVITFEMVVNVNDWCNWALKVGMPSYLIAFIRFKEGMLYDFKPSKGKENTPCPRTVEHVGRIELTNYPEESKYPLISGAAGEGLASEYTAFKKLLMDMPNPDACVLDPDSFEMPHEPSVRFALATAVAARCTEKNFANVIKIADRFENEASEEFAVLLITDSIKRDPKLRTKGNYTKWCIKHQDII